MIIKKVAIGNKEESFIENSFNRGINIISSDDNNKGKTILIQSMMYSLGNEPTFPNTFDYKKYYHYIEFELNDITYSLCRYNDNFVLKYNNVLMIFDNVSELKHYWTKNIFNLPTIIKNQLSKIVDPMLFWQIAFIGQDKKDTSNIINPGLYNKQDFYDMIFDICNSSGIYLSNKETEKIKNKIAKLKDEKANIKKQYKILRSKKTATSYLSSTTDKAIFEEKISEMETLRSRIEELRKSRNRALTRKLKWETTIKELRSLNRTIECGELRCMDCNSTNISFSSSSKGGYSFDVSTVEMRDEIIQSIKDKIDTYNEEIENISLQITKAQEELQEIMKEDDISLESIVAYKQEFFDASDAEDKLNEIEQNISDLNTQLLISEKTTKDTKAKQLDIIKSIINTMNSIYKEIDPSGNLHFDDFFTKRGVVYSGSEATVFHLVKLWAFQNILNHDYPIVIDSFRAEDLSTEKESIILKKYGEIGNQVIFTTTLKKEETGKYDNVVGINHIDFTPHQPSKMLSPIYNTEFQGLLSSLSITL